MNRRLLETVKTFVSSSRSRHQFNFKSEGGIKYPGGITYYPRYPDQQDPEITPSKLFLVERIKQVKHNPYWQKKILKELHIGEDDESKVAIVKNIPEINARLWQIKHLVKITPITFPYGEPTENDINHTIINENGECLVTKQLEVDTKRVKAWEEFQDDPKKMTNETLKKDSRLKWLNPLAGGF